MPVSGAFTVGSSFTGAAGTGVEAPCGAATAPGALGATRPPFLATRTRTPPRFTSSSLTSSLARRPRSSATSALASARTFRGSGISSSSLSANNERDVVPAEAHRVGERKIDLRFAGAVGYVVEVALRIGGFLIDGRRKDPVPHPEDAERGLDRSGGAKGVPR